MAEIGSACYYSVAVDLRTAAEAVVAVVVDFCLTVVAVEELG